MSVYFVAGIHGVGKTTACAEVAKSLGIGHYAASEIIRGEKTAAVPDNSKVVADLDANQQLLVTGVHRILSARERFLLDGHFTLRTVNGVEPIPIPVFEHLRVRGLVLYFDAPENIAARVAERDGGALAVESVRLHQDAEMEHGHAVAQVLSVPLIRLDAFDTDGLKRAVLSWG